jgi:hypothetical protein
MTQFTEQPSTSSVSPLKGSPGWLRWVCTNNPFYVLSAGLFLVGLWISFGAQSGEVETWALMSGLASYTLLLAVTACALVRFGNVWDDVRTVLLLVVLMFLATSVTFDEVLVLHPARGFVFYLLGFFFTIVVSEGLLRGTRLVLPAWFKLPYYLILALFFLYPLALSPLVEQPHSEVLMWGLFGFSTVAGVIFLTLLPAIRKGPDYVRANGSPWRWPLYPWVLFSLLALAVPARAFLLCWSMHLLSASAANQVIFGFYFLLPFGLVLAILLLEIGLVSSHEYVIRLALLAPLGLVALAVLGHRPDPIYRGFLEQFTSRVGDPLTLSILLSAGYYTYASVRRVPRAIEGLTAALVALAVVNPNTWGLRQPDPIRLLPLLAATAIQLGLGVWRRTAWRCLLGGAGLVAVVALALPVPGQLRGFIAFHLGLLLVWVVGTVFHDALGRCLRAAGGFLVLFTCLIALFGRFDPGIVSPRAAILYPLVLAVLLLAYGVVLKHWPSLTISGLVLVCWVALAGWQGYLALRRVVTGLDHILVSLVLFTVAVVISLGKAGILSRWGAAWGMTGTGPEKSEALAQEVSPAAICALPEDPEPPESSRVTR